MPELYIITVSDWIRTVKMAVRSLLASLVAQEASVLLLLLCEWCRSPASRHQPPPAAFSGLSLSVVFSSCAACQGVVLSVFNLMGLVQFLRLVCRCFSLKFGKIFSYLYFFIYAFTYQLILSHNPWGYVYFYCIFCSVFQVAVSIALISTCC